MTLAEVMVGALLDPSLSLMKRFALTLPVLVLFLTACSASVTGDQGGASSSVSESSSSSLASAAASASPAQAGARAIEIQAANWAFTPSDITVKKGEKVTLKLVGVSGNHGLGSRDLGLDVKVNEGQTVTVDLPTDRAGTFSFRCNVLCGEGHQDMTGTITISE